MKQILAVVGVSPGFSEISPRIQDIDSETRRLEQRSDVRQEESQNLELLGGVGV